MLKPMGEDIPALFDRAGCTGQLCVLSLDGTQQVMVDADRPAVPASVIKILVALEAETQFAAGQLDPRERVTLRATERTERGAGLGTGNACRPSPGSRAGPPPSTGLHRDHGLGLRPRQRAVFRKSGTG